MFGYIKAYTPELKLKEYDLYRAAYCGVCKSLGKCTGQCSRLYLTWDSVFMFLLRTALVKEHFEIKKVRCIVHPLKKRNVITASPQADRAARASAVLTYYKLKDDSQDERGTRRLIANIALPVASSAKVRAALPELSASAEELLQELSAMEKDTTKSFDSVADVSAKLTAETFSDGLPNGSPEHRIAYEIGYHVGKYVYAADAIDDLYDDIKRGRYNPYATMFGIEKLSSENAALIGDAIKCEINAVLRALDLIDFSGIQGIKAILYNIVSLGMTEKAKELLTALSGKENKQE